jgi:hypothetical protein
MKDDIGARCDDPGAFARPICPKCQMRMISVTAPLDIWETECLRCGHTERYAILGWSVQRN